LLAVLYAKDLSPAGDEPGREPDAAADDA
jgi:hypothetical protein